MHPATTSKVPTAPRRSAEPLRRPEDVQAVKALLADRPRDLLLFLLGINNALRAGDLLRVTVNHVRALAPGQPALVREKRTGGTVRLTIPAEARQPLAEHLALLAPPPPPANMYLFASQPGWGPLTTERMDQLVEEWAGAVGLRGVYGAHSLRKTFGYLQRTRFGVDPRLLAGLFGHPSPEVTLRYLGLSADEVGEVVLREL